MIYVSYCCQCVTGRELIGDNFAGNVHQSSKQAFMKKKQTQSVNTYPSTIDGIVRHQQLQEKTHYHTDPATEFSFL